MFNLKLHLSLIFALFSFYLRCVYSQQLGDPKIVSTDQIDDRTIKITWSLDDQDKFNITRYRLQYTTAATGDDVYYDWPVQLVPTNYDIDGDDINITTVTSNFQCYNLCVAEPRCNFVIMFKSLNENCHLKSQTADSKLTNLTENALPMIFASISNEIIVNNLPYDNYKFRMAVYDAQSNTWSSFSLLTASFDTTLELFVKIERAGLNSIRVEWEDLGKDFNVTVSRYNVMMSTNNSVFRSNQVFPISTSKLEPNYYDLNAVDDMLLDAGSPQICYSACSSHHDCIAIAYSYAFDDVDQLEVGECVLKIRLRVQNGLYRNDNLVVPYSMITPATEWVFTQAQWNTDYEFKVQYIDVYGAIETSKVVKMYIAKLPLLVNTTVNNNNLSVRFDFDDIIFSAAPTLLKYREKNSFTYNYYYQRSDIDYFDPSEVTATTKTVDDCYELCMYTHFCKAFRWNNNLFPNTCFMIKDTSNQTKCALDTTCVTIQNYNSPIILENMYSRTGLCFTLYIQPQGVVNITLVSDETCFYMPFDVETVHPNDAAFVEGQPNSLYCNYTTLDPSVQLQVNWFRKMQIPLTPENGIQFDDNNKTLKFISLNHTLHSDTYYCSVYINSMTLIYSSNQYQVMVEYPSTLSVPSQAYYLRVGTNANIPCSSDGYPIPKLKWKFFNSSTDIANVTTNGQITYLNFNPVSSSQNGTYICYIDNQQTTFVQVDVITQSVPSKPLIESFKVINNIAKFSWVIEDYGQSKLETLNIEISNNFSEPNSIFYTLMVSYKEVTSGQYSIDVASYENAFLRIKVANIIGLSEDSNEYLIKSTKTSSTASDKYMVPFIVIIVLFSVVLIAVAYYFIIYKKAYKKYNIRNAYSFSLKGDAVLTDANTYSN